MQFKYFFVKIFLLFFFSGIAIADHVGAAYVCRDPLYGCSNPTFIDHDNGGAACPADTVNCDDLNDCGSSMIGYADARDACGYDTDHTATLADGTIYTTALQSDGKIIAGGVFWRYNGFKVQNIVRVIGATGVIDHSFVTGDGFDYVVRTIAVQPDGKILVGGEFGSYDGTYFPRLVRLNSDGSLDTSFDTGSGPDNEVYDIIVQPDGKIMISGEFDYYNDVARGGVARLNADGSLDTTFDPGTGAGGTFNYVYAMGRQSDGKIIIGGSFTSYNGTAKNRLARINTDGSLDTTFNSSGGGPNNDVYDIAVRADDKFFIGGQFTSYNGLSLTRFTLLNANGTYDVTIPWAATRFNSDVRTVIAQPDGKAVVGGYFTTYEGTPRSRIARVNSNGSVDTTFDPGAGADSYLFAQSFQPDNKIVIGGSFTSYDGVTRGSFARVNSDGSLDDAFNGGPVILPVVVTSVPDEITANTASGRVYMESTGGEDVLDVKIQWGTESGVYVNECIASQEYVGDDWYFCNLLDLEESTTYYTRAVATNSAGTDYGDEVVFQTPDALGVETLTVSDATPHTVTLRGNVTGTGDVSEVERSFLIGTSSGYYDYDDSPCSAGMGGVGEFTCDLAYLSPDTTYYYRAVVQSSGGGSEGSFFKNLFINTAYADSDAYGEEMSFHTPPEISTETPTDITSNSATAHANLNYIDEYASADPERYIRWGTDSENLTHVCSAGAGNVGPYSCNMTGLSPDTLYYVRASAYYAEWDWEMYGNVISFTSGSVGGEGDGGTGEQEIVHALNLTVGETLTLDCGADVDLDNGAALIAETPRSQTTTCTVTTNDDDGYNLQVENDRGNENVLQHSVHGTTADGQIQDKLRWNASSPNAQSFTGTGFGFGVLSSTATKDEAWWGTGATCHDPDQLYAGVPSTSEDIMRHLIYSGSNTDTTICYRVNVPSTQSSGDYQGSVTYTATGRP